MAVKLYTFMTAVMIGIIGTFMLNVNNQKTSNLQTGIAEEILRFHVLANSDSEEDQALKMIVKEEIITYLQDVLKDSKELDETRECLKSHLGDIEEKAEEIIAREGYSYQVEAAIEKTFFPRKTYGDLAFPAGEYEALRVKIGKAEGKNWWCVMYPSLCFVDSAHAVVPEEGKELLRELLTAEEYASILEAPPEKIKLRFGLQKIFQKSCNPTAKQLK